MLSLNHLCNSNYGKNYPELKYIVLAAMYFKYALFKLHGSLDYLSISVF